MVGSYFGMVPYILSTEQNFTLNYVVETDYLANIGASQLVNNPI